MWISALFFILMLLIFLLKHFSYKLGKEEGQIKQMEVELELLGKLKEDLKNAHAWIKTDERYVPPEILYRLIDSIEGVISEITITTRQG